MSKDYYMKWCTAHVFMHFRKLKGCVETKSGKRFISPGEKIQALKQ